MKKTKKKTKKMRKAKRLSPFPMQPFIKDAQGTVRFRSNAIVRYLLDEGGLSLNDIAEVDFPQEDYEQFMQLIGYSLCGYHELSFVSDESAFAASKASGGFKGCRDIGCAIHTGISKESPRPNWKPPGEG